MLLEVRGSGHVTVFPPSTHPSDERVEWEGDPDHLPKLEPEDLLSRCGLIAALSVIAMAYPRVPGERDEIALILSGTLVRCSLDDEMVDKLVIEVASIAGDEEAEKRGGKASASRAKIGASDPTWGLPELCSRLKLEDMEGTLRDWLRLKGHATSIDPRPRILVQPGNVPIEVDQAEAALIAAGLGVPCLAVVP